MSRGSDSMAKLAAAYLMTLSTGSVLSEGAWRLQYSMSKTGGRRKIFTTRADAQAD